MGKQLTTSLDIPCPFCRVPKGAHCVSFHGTTDERPFTIFGKRTAHSLRMREAFDKNGMPNVAESWMDWVRQEEHRLNSAPAIPPAQSGELDDLI